MASLDRLPEALRDYGLKVSVEWQPGRRSVPEGEFLGTMGHHTAGRWKRNGTVLLTPSLAIVKHGRPDLPGPLCNGYLGRDLVARCITKGGANHPGKGGPYVIPGYRIPADSARPYLAGWEFEHDGLTEPWADEFLDACARCLAATLDCLGRDSRSHLEHKTWAPGRKSDRNAITLGQARAQIDRARAAHHPNPRPPQEDDDMQLTDHVPGTDNGKGKPLTVGQILDRQAASQQQVNRMRDDLAVLKDQLAAIALKLGS